jgi:hypothetical protein
MHCVSFVPGDVGPVPAGNGRGHSYTVALPPPAPPVQLRAPLAIPDDPTPKKKHIVDPMRGSGMNVKAAVTTSFLVDPVIRCVLRNANYAFTICDPDNLHVCVAVNWALLLLVAVMRVPRGG